MSKYFDKFPIIDYNGQIARNILAKVDFTEKSKRNIYSEFDYVLTEDAGRSDLLSDATYNSPHYDWLIHITNDMIDPYYDYMMTERKFNLHIIAKYGSYANAQSQILFYRNNWAPDDGQVSESIYDGLDNNIQKYYKPIVNISNVIAGYERIKEDWIISTNKITDLYVANTEDYNNGDRITQSSTSAKGTVIRTNANSGIITIQHVDGTFAVGVLGNTTIANTITIQQSIPDEEASFWAPVTAYDQEAEDNEVKKYISLISPNFLPDIEKIFRDLIKK